MKVTLVVCFFLFLTVQVSARAAGGPAAHFEDPEFGYSLDIPSIGDAGGTGRVDRLTVTGSSTGAMPPICTVKVHHMRARPPKDELEAYLKTSFKEFAHAGAKVVEAKRRIVSGLPASTLWYKGFIYGRDLEFGSLAVAGADRVWVVSCLAPTKSFSQYKEAFARAIDSFRVTWKDGKP